MIGFPKFLTNSSIHEQPKFRKSSSQDSSIGSALDWYHEGRGFESWQGREIYKKSRIRIQLLAVGALAYRCYAVKNQDREHILPLQCHQL